MNENRPRLRGTEPDVSLDDSRSSDDGDVDAVALVVELESDSDWNNRPRVICELLNGRQRRFSSRLFDTASSNRLACKRCDVLSYHCVAKLMACIHFHMLSCCGVQNVKSRLLYESYNKHK
jgi:hypothetical protein